VTTQGDLRRSLHFCGETVIGPLNYRSFVNKHRKVNTYRHLLRHACGQYWNDEHTDQVNGPLLATDYITR